MGDPTKMVNKYTKPDYDWFCDLDRAGSDGFVFTTKYTKDTKNGLL
ncbi:MAG: hypothetical protein ACRC10_04305 [Thermoguttaceae bacterium]